MTDIEQPLTGGNVSDEVVRLGATVRKPATPATPAVEAFLAHLRAAGFAAAPRSLGVDDRDRHVLEFVPGQMADTMPPMTEPELVRVGRMIRRLHDIAEEFTPPADARWDVAIAPDDEVLICHHDLAPWNLVRDGDRWVFIDWDGAGPGSRLWDLAYAAHGFVPLHPDGDPHGHAPRLRAIVDGYGLDEAQRAALAPLLAVRIRSMADLLQDGARTGRQPWARLHVEGHADYWDAAAEYAARHTDVWATTLMAPSADDLTLDRLAADGTVPADWRERHERLRRRLAGLPAPPARSGDSRLSQAILADRAESAGPDAEAPQ